MSLEEHHYVKCDKCGAAVLCANDEEELSCHKCGNKSFGRCCLLDDELDILQKAHEENQKEQHKLDMQDRMWERE